VNLADHPPIRSSARTIMIRTCQPADAAQICGIYNPYIKDTVVTFEEIPLSTGQMAERIADVTERYPWLVFEEAGRVVGYSYATTWKTRSAYRHSVESAVYLPQSHCGRGIGSELYRALIAELRLRDVHAIVGGIALPNEASIALHEKLGFAKIGHFREIGWKLGRWVDVGYWQLIL
jgi:phosphinothricin acetyltransferase